MAEQGKLLTAAEFQQWLTPTVALGRLTASWTERQRRDAILRGMKNGSLLVVARSFIGIDVEGRKSQGFTMLEPAMWSDPWRPRARDFWTTGDIEFDNDPGIDIMFRVNLYDEARHDGPTVTVYFNDVRFHPPTFEAAFEGQLEPKREIEPEPDEEETAPATGAASKRGRPPKEWWDDLWTAMFRKIHFGELTPKRQADLENAMHDWLAEHGHEASERTVRGAARKLFEALRDEGKN